jgi:hypothetical protein
MRKLNASFRIDRTLLTQARTLATRDHMTLTQFVTQALLRAVRMTRHATRLIACVSLMLFLSACGLQAQREAEQRYVNSLTPEQFERYDAGKQAAIGLFLGSGGFRSLQPLQGYQPPVSQVPRQLNCYSNTYVTQTQTTCY